MHPGLGRNWGTALIGVYGLSLVGAGVFIADPVLGFPVGTPTEPTVVTWHGVMHFISGGVGFLALVVACFVFARRFAALGQEGWRTFSLLTGVIFLAGFVGIASGSGSGWSILGFWVALVIAWSWLSALSVRLAGGTEL